MEEFALYIDDSGSPKPDVDDATPHFAMGGVIVKRSDKTQISDELSAFKESWNIDRKIPLHASEIRSKKGNFTWLGEVGEAERQRFHDELGQMIVRCPVIIHACVISRSGYIQRYSEKYGIDTWNMMRTAFCIVVERTAKYAIKRNGKIMVYFEKIGRVEDRKLKKYFEELRSQGMPFDGKRSAAYQPLHSPTLQGALSGLEGKTKNCPELQIADLSLYPIALGKENPENKAYKLLKSSGKIIDSHLTVDEVTAMGVKYFCFDT